MKVAASLSIRSLKSRRSVTNRGLTGYEREYENVKEFELCFPAICNRYGLGRAVHVKKEFREDIYLKHFQATESKKRRRTIIGAKPPVSVVSKQASEPTLRDTATSAATEPAEPTLDVDTIIIAAMYDNFNRFVELFLYKLDEPPRELIKLIGFIARYYFDLKKIKIQLSKMDAYTNYELSKLINVSSISEVDLDGSYCRAGNYAILFETGRITSISLSRCNINDKVCEDIASKLYFQAPAEKSLYTLNLSSNGLTDAGAISLSNALRSNRTLRYLNLAGNRITDTGAAAILDSLQQFPLTSEENVGKSQRYIEYEKKRLAFYFKFFNDFKARSVNESSKSFKTNITKRKMSAYKGRGNSMYNKQKESKKDHHPDPIKTFNYEDLKNRAEVLAGEMMGPFHDPFKYNNLKIINGKCHSKGNMVLCYLNLAYNNLGYHSLVKLLDVLRYQSNVKTQGQIGLLKVILIGNDLPISCDLYTKIDDLLTKSMMSSGGRAFSEFSTRRKSRLSGKLSMITTRKSP